MSLQAWVPVLCRANTCVQPTALVTVLITGTITPSHRSVNTGAVKLGLAGHSTLPSDPCALVTAGAVVSCTVMVCVRFGLLPQASVALQDRAITCVHPTALVTVLITGTIKPSHRSVNTGAVKLGLAGHSTLPSDPCALVTAGAVVSCTVMA